jgi:hypothetical protein
MSARELLLFIVDRRRRHLRLHLVGVVVGGDVSR